jgi:hypothetical protein
LFTNFKGHVKVQRATPKFCPAETRNNSTRSIPTDRDRTQPIRKGDDRLLDPDPVPATGTKIVVVTLPYPRLLRQDTSSTETLRGLTCASYTLFADVSSRWRAWPRSHKAHISRLDDAPSLGSVRLLYCGRSWVLHHDPLWFTPISSQALSRPLPGLAPPNHPSSPNF